jgi:hypothetical protein
MTRSALALAIAFALALSACSVEKLAPIQMVHRGTPGAPVRRVVVLPTECAASDYVGPGEDARAWCAGVSAIVAEYLAFHGIEVVDLAKLPARERTRVTIEVQASAAGTHHSGTTSGTSEHRRVTVEGPTYSDVDMWTQREALAELGIDAVVHVRAARTPTWPVRTLALVRMVRPRDASLVTASVCELEVSRIDGEARTIERALRCALTGVTP